MDSAIHVWIEVDGTPARVLDKTLRGSNSASCFVEAKDSQKFNVVFTERRTAGPKQSYALEVLVDGKRYVSLLLRCPRKLILVLFASELDRKSSRITILCSSRIRTRRIESSPSSRFSRQRSARFALSSRQNGS